MTNDDIERLERNLVAAFDRVKKSTGKSAGGAENAYGQAYQALVRAGARPQIRHRLRCPKG